MVQSVPIYEKFFVQISASVTRWQQGVSRQKPCSPGVQVQFAHRDNCG